MSNATGEEPVALLSLRDADTARLVFRGPISDVPLDLVTDASISVRVRGLAAGLPMVVLRDGRLLWPYT